jgi:hypothetical protein
MNMYMKKNRRNPDILDIFFGPGVNAGRSFNGNASRNASGAKPYSHVQGRRSGSDYVIKGGSSLVRPRNVNGRINSRSGY